MRYEIQRKKRRYGYCHTQSYYAFSRVCYFASYIHYPHRSFHLCTQPLFLDFLIIPLMSLVLSFAVLLFIKYDENVFLSLEKKDHIFEIKDNHLFKDGKEIKLVKSIKMYRYKSFLYMETSHSMFIIKDADFIIGDRESLLKWATVSGIKVKIGY